MIRISLPYIWSLTEQMETIAKADSARVWSKLDLALELIPAEVSLETLLQSSVFANTLRSSRELGYDLVGRLRSEIRYEPQSEGGERTYALPSIQYTYSQFRTAFLAELGTFPAYL